MMPLSRRELLHRAAATVGVGTFGSGPIATVLGQTPADALARRVHHDLLTHASFGRKFSGGPGDTANARWIAERLRGAGYDVAEPTFAAPYFDGRETRFATGVEAAGVIPQGPVVPTGAEGITARLALIEADPDHTGPVGDVRDKIALVVAPFGRHAALFPTRGFGATVVAAAEAGAVAVVMITTGPSGEAVALNCPPEPFVPVPAAVLAPKVAEPFVAAARAGEPATLVLDGDATLRRCLNVVARLERGPQWLAISTPRSGWFDCVAERGTGTAAFLELAAWARDRYPAHSIFMMNTGGHEYFFEGSHHALREAPPAEDTLVWVHVGATLAARDAEARDGEWIMLDTADPQRYVMATQSANAAAARAFRGLSGMSPPRAIRPQAGELSTFTGLGYTTAFAAIGVHRWFHTTSDTLACVDAGLVVPVIEAHKRTVELIVG
jgi:hypothetical protein